MAMISKLIEAQAQRQKRAIIAIRHVAIGIAGNLLKLTRKICHQTQHVGEFYHTACNDLDLQQDFSRKGTPY
jgi:hypothetical protein